MQFAHTKRLFVCTPRVYRCSYVYHIKCSLGTDWTKTRIFPYLTLWELHYTKNVTHTIQLISVSIYYIALTNTFTQSYCLVLMISLVNHPTVNLANISDKIVIS